MTTDTDITDADADTEAMDTALATAEAIGAIEFDEDANKVWINPLGFDVTLSVLAVIDGSFAAALRSGQLSEEEARHVTQDSETLRNAGSILFEIVEGLEAGCTCGKCPQP